MLYVHVTMLMVAPRFSFRGLVRTCRLSSNLQQGTTDYPDFQTAEDYYEEMADARKLQSFGNFKELGVTSKLCRALEREGIVAPTPIQCIALPETLSGDCNCMIQSETGTGKTLTYLLPALQDTRPGLTSVILTPSRELATQVFYWSRKLAGGRKESRRVAIMVSGPGEEEQSKAFKESKPHVLIGTPKRLLQLVEENRDVFHAVRRIVLDEGDKILQPLGERAPWRKRKVRDSHPRPGKTVVEMILRGRQRMDMICSSATISKSLRAELADIGWGSDARFISTVKQPMLPAAIEHQYIRCSSDGEDEVGVSKIAAFVEYFRRCNLTSSLVFIRSTSPMDNFVSALTSRGVRAAALYKSLTPELYEKFLSHFRRGEVEVLVGTDQTVRGLDFCFVDTVFLMEAPRNAHEYIHLAGRVGRMGKCGRAVVIVDEEAPRDLVRLQRIHTQLGVQGTEIE